MKRLMVMALLATLIFACSKGNENAGQLIIGQWKYDTQAILDDANKRNISDQDKQLVQGTMAVYKDAVFNFKADSTLVIVSNGINQFGSWKMSENGKTLFLNLSGQDQPNTVSSISSGRIVLAPDPQRGIRYSRIFIPTTGATGQE